MASTKIECGFTGCVYVSEHASEAVALLQFQSHMSVHQQSSNQATGQKLPPIERPVLKQDITEEEWESFKQYWKRFKRVAALSGSQIADQLFMCCESALGRLILKQNPDIIEAGESQLLDAMRQMSVIKVATSIRRTKLMTMKQEQGQSIREFYANAKSQAATCSYTVKCNHACCVDHPDIDYTAHVVKDIIICGIADPEISRDILELEKLDEKTVSELVGIIEGKETARKALATGSQTDTAGVSNYRKANKGDPGETKFNIKTNCSKCNTKIAQYAKNRFGKINKTPFTKCMKCHKEDTQNKQLESNNKSEQANPKSDQAAIQSFIE